MKVSSLDRVVVHKRILRKKELIYVICEMELILILILESQNAIMSILSATDNREA